MKLSIVMAYYNRYKQLLHTIESISKTLYDKNDFEIIIVNDASDPSDVKLLLEGLEQYNLLIHVLHITKEEKGERRNPSIPFNIGFRKAIGEIILIQNPESYHVDDIISYTVNNLTFDDYLVYNTYNISLEASNEIFYMLSNKTFEQIEMLPKDPGHPVWMHHHTLRPTYYHFCSAIYRQNLMMIGGFDEEYKNGYCYDDDDLLFRIRDCLRLNIKSSSCLVVNQYHKPAISTNCNIHDMSSPITQKWWINRNLYYNKINNINRTFRYPRILHLYWVGKLTFLNYITVLSFKRYHPGWIINIYTTNNTSNDITWSTDEQKLKIHDDVEDYFDKLSGVNIIDCSWIIEELNITSMNYIYQSDIIRVYLLNKYGGVWADFDIIFIKNIENIFCNYNRDILFECYVPYFIYYPIGFFISNRGSEVFKYVLDMQLFSKNDSNSYQKYGSELFHYTLQLYHGYTSPQKYGYGSPLKSDKIHFLNNQYYLPCQSNAINQLYRIGSELPGVTDNTVGIHWFNGHDLSKRYINMFNKQAFKKILVMDYLIESYINDL